MSVITLGGKDYPVTAFTFDQLETILPVFDAAWKLPMTGGGFGAARDIIKAALGGQVAPEEFLALKVTVPELLDAVGVIGEVSGLLVAGEAKAQAGATGSTGSTSSPTSAPAPAGTEVPSAA